MKARTSNPSLWTERYESLRQHVLQNNQVLGIDPLGLILLARGGMAAWMRNWAAPASATTNSARLSAELPVAMPPDWQRELILVLGPMTFQHLPLSLNVGMLNRRSRPSTSSGSLISTSANPGGVLNKAQRAELRIPLPIGLVYDEDQQVILDPDQQVQQSIRIFFATYERVGSAWATVQYFHPEGLKFPRRGRAGSGEVAWQQLTYGIALDTLHNPRYAGAFCFGRTRTWKDLAGKIHCQQ